MLKLSFHAHKGVALDSAPLGAAVQPPLYTSVLVNRLLYISGSLGQLSDGQNRVGGGLPTGQYCIDSSGAITDSSYVTLITR